MYAIVKVGGKQYRVEKGDSLLVDRMSEDEGATVSLVPLLFAPDGPGEPVFSGAGLAKVSVEAKVTGHERGKKIHVLKFKPKHGYKRRMGFRADLTRIEIGTITGSDAKPAAAKATVAEQSVAAKKPAATKAAAVAKPAKAKPAKAKDEEATDGA